MDRSFNILKQLKEYIQVELDKPNDYYNEHTFNHSNGYKQCLKDIKEMIENKENEMYNIIEKFITKNRSHKPLIYKGIVLHDTGNQKDTAMGNFNWFNTGNRQASAHFFIDKDIILNTVPITEMAWHAGKTANSRYIGIEMCHTDNFENIYNKSVWLTAKLLLKQNILVADENTIMSHEEVSRKWKETNHIDPTQFLKNNNKTIDGFRSDVQKTINNMIFENAVMKLKSKGIINTPEYWLNNIIQENIIDTDYVSWIIIKAANKFKPVIDIKSAIDVLKQNGIVSSPDYWLTNAEYNKDFIRQLIINIANKF